MVCINAKEAIVTKVGRVCRNEDQRSNGSGGSRIGANLRSTSVVTRMICVVAKYMQLK
jgi:hypothetical protein